MTSIGIVMPILNNWRGAVEAIESIDSAYPYQLYIQPQWRENKPLSAAWNKGILDSIADGHKFIAVVNDDILCSYCTLDILVDSLCKMEEAVLVSARAHNDHLGWDPTGIHSLGPVTEDVAECPDFAFFMIRSDFVEKCGWFDPGFNPAWHEDNDMHRRINLLGHKAYSIGAAPYYHFVSKTGKEISASNPEYFKNSKKYYIEKWGGYLGNEQYLTPFNNPNKTPKDIER